MAKGMAVSKAVPITMESPSPMNRETASFVEKIFRSNIPYLRMEPHGQSPCLHAEAFRRASVVPRRRPQGANIPYQRTNSPTGRTPACRQAWSSWFGIDGEVLVGSTLGYDPKRQGFFIFPADPKSNNVRVYIVSSGRISGELPIEEASQEAIMQLATN